MARILTAVFAVLAFASTSQAQWYGPPVPVYCAPPQQTYCEPIRHNVYKGVCAPYRSDFYAKVRYENNDGRLQFVRVRVINGIVPAIDDMGVRGGYHTVVYDYSRGMSYDRAYVYGRSGTSLVREPKRSRARTEQKQEVPREELGRPNNAVQPVKPADVKPEAESPAEPPRDELQEVPREDLKASPFKAVAPDRMKFPKDVEKPSFIIEPSYGEPDEE